MAGLRKRAAMGWWLGGLVRERARFVLRHVFMSSQASVYHLRGSERRVLLRHDNSDAWVLHEVFQAPFYSPPEPVRRILHASDAPLNVLDLGGNIGFYGLHVRSEFPDARVTAFEPDPANVSMLRQCIELNELGEVWSVVEACAATADGEMSFSDGGGALSRAPMAGETGNITVAAHDVFPWFEGVGLLKMDIEGGEWALLTDPRFAAAAPPAILLEWHSYQCAEDNPRRAATDLLEQAGYRVLHENPPPVPDDQPLYGAGTLWAWREP